ncbi:MAG: low molecular weight phosphotyrosine protein phosphatase [Bradymonadaceae bacterium]|nr:low molecular weight phosphotyrosine protein phosphatase [Lujinxingiaceae bacterium]
MQEPIRVMFFCLGNICRSPLAEALFQFHVNAQGLSQAFHIESSGTGSYHVGEPPDAGSVRVARRRLGLDISDQRAQQLVAEHMVSFDYLVAMDRSNQRNSLRLGGSDSSKVLLLRDFEPQERDRGGDVPDPWGGGGQQFDEVYDIVDRCVQRLLAHVLNERGI